MGHRGNPSGIVARLARTLTVLALLASPPAIAHAQATPMPQAIPLEMLVDAVVDCGVRVPQSTVLDAYEEYANATQKAMVEAIDAYVKGPLPAPPKRMGPTLPGTAPRPGTTREEILADPALKRLCELDDRAFATSTRLISQFVDRLAAAAPGQDEYVSTLRTFLDYMNAYGHMSGGYGQRVLLAPLDFGNVVIEGRDTLTTDQLAEQRPRWIKIQLANLAGRRQSVERYIKDLQRERMMGSSVLTHDQPATLEFARQQMKSFAEVEALLTPREKLRLQSRWLPMLVGRTGMGWQQTAPRGLTFNIGSSADYMAMILRIKDLTDDQRKTIRAIGTSWLAEESKLLRAAVEQSGGGADPGRAQEECQALAFATIARLSEVLGAPEMVAQPARFPTVEFMEALPDEDAELFAVVRSRPVQSEQRDNARARSQQRPVGYEVDMSSQLAEDLGLTDSQRVIFEVAIADARTRWEQQVKPIVDQSFEVTPQGGGMMTPEIRQGWYASIGAAQKKATEAFGKAYECDATLFTALDAALPKEVNRKALLIAATARRTREAVGGGISDRTSLVVLPADVPQALLAAPLSKAGRVAAFAEAASFMPQWETLGRQRQENNREMYVERRLHPIAMSPDGKPIVRPPTVQPGEYESTEPSRAKELEAEQARITAAWEASEKECVERIAGVLQGADVGAWRSSVQRVRWPRAFADVSDVLRVVNGVPETGARQKAMDAFTSQNASVQADGERFIVARVSANQLPAGGAATSQQIRFSTAPLEGMQASRVVLLTERVRSALPPDMADQLERHPALKRLEAANSQATATATQGNRDHE